MQDNNSSAGASPADCADNVPPAVAAVPSATEGPPPLPASARPSSVKLAIAWCQAQGRTPAAVAWKFVCDVLQYYWGMRLVLWEYIAGFAPNMMSESVRMREVRLAPYESHA